MTVLGSHTVSELRDLVNAYDYMQSNFDKALAGAANRWIEVDANAYTIFKGDYDAWNKVYQIARNAANTKLSNTWTSTQDITAAEVEFSALSKAFIPFTDFNRRIPKYVNLGNYAPNVPQPLARDLDLATFKSTDSTTRAMPDAVKSFIGNVTPGLAPENADSKAYAPMPMWKKVAIGVGAVLGLGAFVKIAK